MTVVRFLKQTVPKTNIIFMLKWTSFFWSYRNKIHTCTQISVVRYVIIISPHSYPT